MHGVILRFSMLKWMACVEGLTPSPEKFLVIASENTIFYCISDT